MKRWLALVLVYALANGFVAVVGGQGSGLDYTQWRGQHRDGAASAFAAPATWPERLTRRWGVEVGEGYGTPLVVGEMVYVFTRRGSDEVMTALRAATGDVAWQTAYPAPFSPQHNARLHGSGPKSTPVFSNGRVYALGINGAFTAFDAATGKQLWQKAAPSTQPEYGTAASPLAHDGLVIAHPGNYDPLTAFDGQTGAVKWRAGDPGAFASPILVEIAGVKQIVTVTQRNVAGVSPADGKGLWSFPWPRDISAITPVLYRDLVIVGSQNHAPTAIRIERRGSGWRASAAWQSQDVSLYTSNPVVVGDVLYGLSRRGSGQFFALDAATGHVLWLGPPRASPQSAIVKANDLLFLLNHDARLSVVRAGGKAGLEPLKHYTVAESPTWAQPAISGNRIFVKDASSLTLWTLN